MPNPDDESEFGLGPGMIDPANRANRVVEPWQEMAEIKALPKTFDSAAATSIVPADPSTTPVPRLLPGETEADRA